MKRPTKYFEHTFSLTITMESSSVFIVVIYTYDNICLWMCGLILCTKEIYTHKQTYMRETNRYQQSSFIKRQFISIWH